MPTKCLKSENLFDIVKRIINDLEETGFQVLSIITDNNAINKKAISFFCCPPKLSIVYPHPIIKSQPLFSYLTQSINQIAFETIGLDKKTQINVCYSENFVLMEILI